MKTGTRRTSAGGRSFLRRGKVRPAARKKAVRRVATLPGEYRLEAQEQQGTASILLGDDRFPVLDRFWVGVELEDGNVLTSAQSGWTRRGQTLTAAVADGRIMLDLTMTRSANPSGALLAVAVRNVADRPLTVKTVRVAHTMLGPAHRAWGDPGDWTLLKMGYTFGRAHREEVDARNSALIPMSAERVNARCWGTAALRFGPDRRGIVLGFTDAARQLGWVDVRRDGPDVEVAATVELDGAPVPAYGKIACAPLFVGISEDVRALLPAYAGVVAATMKVKLKPAPTGWCSWYFYRKAGITHDLLLRQAKFIAARRKELPFEIIQLDDGYAAAYGDWLAPTDRFPGGVERVAAGIRKVGLTPGLWLAPFVAQADSALFKAHPEWMVKNDDGAPLGWDVEWAEPKVPWYALDGSHPEVQAWLTELFASLRKMGFAYFKLDFLFLGMIRGTRAKPGTRVEAYRKGLAAIREGAKDAYILGCTAPYPPSIGLVDGLRVSHDVFPGGGVFKDSLAEAVRETHQRWWAHGTLWNADHDVAVVRDMEGSTAGLAALSAGSVSLSGGAWFTSDPLDELVSDRLRLVEAALADRRPEAAVPLDVFERAEPRLLAQRAGKGRWRVGILNPTPQDRAATFDLDRLGIAAAKVAVIAGDTPRQLGTIRRRLLTPPVPAMGLLLLSVEEV